MTEDHPPVPELFDDFEQLLANYSACLECADGLESPNPEDSRFTKMAIVGFSHYEDTSNWQRGHFEIASDYLAESESIDLPEGAKLYSMLALGALLGMHSAGQIDDRVFRVGLALLPGFVFYKGKVVFELHN